MPIKPDHRTPLIRFVFPDRPVRVSDTEESERLFCAYRRVSHTSNPLEACFPKDYEPGEHYYPIDNWGTTSQGGAAVRLVLLCRTEPTSNEWHPILATWRFEHGESLPDLIAIDDLQPYSVEWIGNPDA